MLYFDTCNYKLIASEIINIYYRYTYFINGDINKNPQLITYQTNLAEYTFGPKTVILYGELDLTILDVEINELLNQITIIPMEFYTNTKTLFIYKKSDLEHVNTKSIYKNEDLSKLANIILIKDVTVSVHITSLHSIIVDTKKLMECPPVIDGFPKLTNFIYGKRIKKDLVFPFSSMYGSHITSEMLNKPINFRDLSNEDIIDYNKPEKHVKCTKCYRKLYGRYYVIDKNDSMNVTEESYCGVCMHTCSIKYSQISIYRSDTTFSSVLIENGYSKDLIGCMVISNLGVKCVVYPSGNLYIPLNQVLPFKILFVESFVDILIGKFIIPNEYKDYYIGSMILRQDQNLRILIN